jgi:hypothetical protein
VQSTLPHNPKLPIFHGTMGSSMSFVTNFQFWEQHMGRPSIGKTAMTPAERQWRHRRGYATQRKSTPREEIARLRAYIAELEHAMFLQDEALKMRDEALEKAEEKVALAGENIQNLSHVFTSEGPAKRTRKRRITSRTRASSTSSK